MKIAIYTYELNLENVHLLPWRIILEVAIEMEKVGNEILVYSGTTTDIGEEWDYKGIKIKNIPKLRAGSQAQQIRIEIEREQPDVLYWPFAWWGAGKVGRFLQSLDNLILIGYIPGAVYKFRAIIAVIHLLSIKTLLPYIAQSIYPTRFLVRGLKTAGLVSIITMTEYTRRALITAGWPEKRVFAISPGKASFPLNKVEPSSKNIAPKKTTRKKYFLFFGPPTPIRGVYQLLDAFEHLLRTKPDAYLVCLFRDDSNIELEVHRHKIESKIKRNSLVDRVECHWQSLSRSHLAVCVENCHAVVLPFLLVPSEIPLAIIESAGYGKPVISTGPSGTGEFVKEFGLCARTGSAKDLAKKMDALLVDDEHYDFLSQKASLAFQKSETWAGVARAWLKASGVDQADN